MRRFGISTTAILIRGPSRALKLSADLGRSAPASRGLSSLLARTDLISENYSILVAGCGTSQAAKHALRWPEAQVTGIDVSATSVRCTGRVEAQIQP